MKTACIRVALFIKNSTKNKELTAKSGLHLLPISSHTPLLYEFPLPFLY